MLISVVPQEASSTMRIDCRHLCSASHRRSSCNSEWLTVAVRSTRKLPRQRSGTYHRQCTSCRPSAKRADILGLDPSQIRSSAPLGVRMQECRLCGSAGRKIRIAHTHPKCSSIGIYGALHSSASHERQPVDVAAVANDSSAF